jgi:acetate kinase
MLRGVVDNMKALAMNAGSTSIKFAVYEGEQEIRAGELSWSDGRRGHARLVNEHGGGSKDNSVVDVRDDQAAAAVAIRSALGSDQQRSPISVVGHRIVHGGPQFRDSTLIDDAVRGAVAEWSHLAPLHNSLALQVIQASEAALPATPQVAVFDTSFYKSLRPRSFLYSLPLDYYRRWRVRRFGFHGISYAYCAQRAAELLDRNPARLNLVICHLGGGCSVTAVRGGRAVATTSGYSPLDGLMMGTRCGSLDPGVLLDLQRKRGLKTEEMERDLNYRSGLLGVSGISADIGDIESAAAEGNKRAVLAFEMFADRLRSAIGGLAVTLGKLDALVFTDRMGEGSPRLRAASCTGLEILGVRLDSRRNNECRPDADIAADDSRSRVLVLHTREELMVAREAMRILETRATVRSSECGRT